MSKRGFRGRGTGAGPTDIADNQVPEQQAKSPLSRRQVGLAREFMYRREMTLPTSGKQIMLEGKEVNPADTWVDQDINPRDQSLLSMEDPKVSDLYEKVMSESQRDPALVREKEGPHGEKYQIIWGSRRRFVCLHESNRREEAKTAGEEGIEPYNLLIEVGDISDVDAIRLARAENEDREQLSVYEEALDILRLKKGICSNMTYEDIGATKGMTKSTVAKYLGIAGIPEKAVRLLQGPHLLTTKNGPKLKSFLDALSESQKNAYEKLVREKAKFDDVAKLIAEIKEVDSVVPFKESRKPRTFGEEGNGCFARLTPKRGEAGAYTIKLSGMSEQDIRSLEKHLARMAK